MGSTFLFAQFAALVGLLVLYATGSVFLSDRVAFGVLLLAVPLLAVSLLVVLGHTLWRPSWRKTLRCAGVLVAAAAAFLAVPYAAAAGNWLFVKSREAALEAFIRDIDGYARIRQMSDGERHFKELNGALIAFEIRHREMDSGRSQPDVLPIETVLARDRIDRARYEDFRRRLIGLRLTEFDATPTYVAFLHGGMLDDLSGLIYVRSGAAPPPMDSPLFKSKLIRLQHVTGNWYWFGTT
jgi:hypothetical protein